MRDCAGCFKVEVRAVLRSPVGQMLPEQIVVQEHHGRRVLVSHSRLFKLTADRGLIHEHLSQSHVLVTQRGRCVARPYGHPLRDRGNEPRTRSGPTQDRRKTAETRRVLRGVHSTRRITGHRRPTADELLRHPQREHFFAREIHVRKRLPAAPMRDCGRHACGMKLPLLRPRPCA